LPKNLVISEPKQLQSAKNQSACNMSGAGEQRGAGLSGEWIGYYTGHYDEIIRIITVGGNYEAWKVTGDDYVPAGELTWRVNADSLRGTGQIAERGFRNPKFVPGHLEILGAEQIRFHWEGYAEVEYRHDD
jgi:hypothetical protein